MPDTAKVSKINVSRQVKSRIFKQKMRRNIYQIKISKKSLNIAEAILSERFNF